MSYRNFIMALARGARGKEAAKALILPEIFGGTGSVNSGIEAEVSGTPPLSLPNSLGKPLKSWGVSLTPYQEGTGDPSPDNVRPIHGTDKLTITTTGKNLLDVSTLLVRASGAYQVLDNGYVTIIASDGAAWGNVPTMSIPAGTYTLSRSQTLGSCDIRLGYENYASSHVLGAGRDSMSITITQDTMLKFKGDYGSDVAYPITDCFQLELGSTATDFTPYIAPSQTVITLPQTIYSGSVSDGGAVSRTRYRLYNGDSSEEWTYSSALSKTNTAVFYSNVPLTDALFTDFAVTYITNCNLLPPKSRQLLYDYDTQGIAYSGSYSPALHYLTVRIQKTIASTVEEFTALLASNPLEVVYMLIDPVQFPITAPTIPTPKGNATAWATAEDGTVENMEVTYVSKK